MREIYPRCYTGTTSAGLAVLTEPMPGYRGVALGLWVKAGSREDPEDKAGLAHLVEHMTFKGTLRRSAREIAQEVDALGGNLNASTTAEHTFFYTEVLRENLTEALEILQELVISPRFAPEDLARERMVIAEEIRALEDAPEEVALRIFGEALWGDHHPLGRPVIGRPETLPRIEVPDLWDFFHRYFRPSQMALVACGDVDPQEFSALAESFPDSGPPGDLPLRASPKPQAGLRLAERDVQQVHLVLGFPTVPVHAPERYAIEVLNALLGGGVSSRLFQRIREEQGLVYTVFSGTTYFSDAGVLFIYAACEEERIGQVLEGIWAEIQALVQAPPEPEELSRAIRRLRSTFLLSLDDPTSRMIRLGAAAALGRTPLSPEEVGRRIAAVKPEEVQELARRFLRPEAAAWGVVGPSSARLAQILERPLEVG